MYVSACLQLVYPSKKNCVINVDVLVSFGVCMVGHYIHSTLSYDFIMPNLTMTVGKWFMLIECNTL